MSFEDRISEVVQGILSDSTQLPAEFMNALPQIVAQNPVPTAKTSGMRIARGSNTSTVSTAGTTFAGGADLLATALEFQATGFNDYIVEVSASDWYNNNASGANQLHANLDGADAGIIGQTQFTAVNAFQAISVRGVLVKPAVGTHTLNVRFFVTAGTGNVEAGSGGAAAKMPIVVTLEVA